MTDETKCGCAGAAQGQGLHRRSLLLAAGAALASIETAAADDDQPDNPEAEARPKAGDLLVHANGGNAGKPVSVDDFATPDTLVQAWAKDPKSGVVRNASRLNRILLVRIDPASMDEDTKPRSASGVVAYSDFCVHAGCWIEAFKPADHAIICQCHSSMYDPRHSAMVIGGPAKGPLAALPLKVADGHLVAAGAFIGRLGIIT